MTPHPTALSIVHEPHGSDGRYDARFEERRPRDPVGGDMVSIGFLTRPGGVADDVRLHWQRNGRPQTTIHARAVARGTDEDRWLVELGVLEAADAVEYWITATGNDEAAESPHYAFTTHQWRQLVGISAAAQIDNGIELATMGEDGLPGPSLRVSDNGVMRVTVGPSATGARTAQQPSPPAPSPLRGRAGTLPSPFRGRRVGDEGCSLAVDPNTGKLTLQGPDREPVSLSLRWLASGNGQLVAVEIVGDLARDEAIVGFGERFDALDQHGRAPDIAVYEQYKNQGNRTYLPVPFFFSSRGYGCLIEGTSYVTYDLGRTIPDRWRCVAGTSGQGLLSIALFGGTPTEILSQFFDITGRPEPIPAWAFGPWMSSNEWNTQARVECEVARTQELGIPATALVIEAWSDETTFYIWNGAEYTPRDGADAPRLSDFTFPSNGPWPDPKAMVDALHEAGIRLLLWQIPALKHIEEPHPQHDADVAHAVSEGYVIRNSDNQPYRNPAFWFNNALIPDFTHPEATDWWLRKRAYLIDDLGIDGFKTDGGEHLQGRGLRAYDARRGSELINAFPNLYIGAYHRLLRERRGADALTFSRAGHTGAGRFPAHWAGDENSTWETYRRSIVSGLTAGLSGVPFWAWDIAGFSDALPTAELYLRATAMACFCPIMQYHSEYNPSGPSRDRTPWNVARVTGDERVVPLSRFFARLRMNLIPYIVAEAAHTVATGEPLMRPLLLDEPNCLELWQIQDQYRFGRDLLVAPMVEEGADTRHLFLLPGDWYNFWDGSYIQGGCWIETTVPLDRIPVYVRAGTILPLNLGATGNLGDDVGNEVDRYTTLTFWLYPSGHTTYDWVDAVGMTHRIEMAQQADGTIQVTLPALPALCVLAVRGQQPVTIEPSETDRVVTLD